MFFDPTSFTPLIRLEQALPIPEKIKPLGDIMEAETEMSLPKIVKDRFNRLEKEINEDNLSEEMQIWLKQMGMTKESLKADFIPAKPEKQKLTKHYYHTDQIGTPLALITEKGEKAWEIITDPYGRRVREENPNKLYQPIRMQGQHYDAESNLHYNRHRYYDPNIGRYISQDPIGLHGGINNYVYPLNPNQAIDPLGLQSSYDRMLTRKKRMSCEQLEKEIDRWLNQNKRCSTCTDGAHGVKARFSEQVNGKMSPGTEGWETHDLEIKEAQEHLRSSLEAWDNNNCGGGSSGPPPVDAWKWATKPRPTVSDWKKGSVKPSRWGWFGRLIRVPSIFMFMPDPCGEYGGLKDSPTCHLYNLENQIY